jgi:hypothetical protein
MTPLAITGIAVIAALVLVYCMWNPKIRIHAVDNWRVGYKFLSVQIGAVAAALEGLLVWVNGNLSEDQITAMRAQLESQPMLFQITHSTWYHNVIQGLMILAVISRFLKQTHQASPDLVPPLGDVEKK